MKEEIVSSNDVLRGLLCKIGINALINCPLMLTHVSDFTPGEIYYFHNGVTVAIYIMKKDESWWNFSEYGVNLFRPYILEYLVSLQDGLMGVPTIDENGEGLR